MVSIKLRRLRQVLAAFYFILFVFAFIDFSSSLSTNFINWLLYLQFTPSLIRFLKIGGLMATGFLFVLTITILFGRFYCSALCPLGIFQDLVARLRQKKARYKYLEPWNIIRYLTLFVVLVSAFAGSLFLVYMLDPYSIAGRIFSDLVRPLYYGINNLLVKLLSFIDSYALHHVDFKAIPWQGLAITSGVTLAIAILAWRWGRLFCNSFCPVGALLSLFSRFSIFKLRIDLNSCTTCGRCLRECKASCIDINAKTIDFSRCVACYNCIDSCKEKGISYKLSVKTKPAIVTDKDDSRRKFLNSLVGIIVGLSAFSYSFNVFGQRKKNTEGKKDSGNIVEGQSNVEQEQETRVESKAGSRPNRRLAPITPPGSFSHRDYLNACTACHLCVSACPTHVLQPSVREFGVFGVLQPHMDFRSGFCNYECTKCGEICPTGAIRPLELETKKRSQLGKARFHMGNCIVRVDRTECGACSEHCPTKAVFMVPWQGLLLPQVNEDICIGCGACEYACPTEPYKAIYVNGSEVHGVAELPAHIDKGPRKSQLDDFPF